MKITFYYENGTTYTANNVLDYEEHKHQIEYHSEKCLAKGVYQYNRTTIVKDTLIAYQVNKENEVILRKLKPCAILTAYVCKVKSD